MNRPYLKRDEAEQCSDDDDHQQCPGAVVEHPPIIPDRPCKSGSMFIPGKWHKRGWGLIWLQHADVVTNSTPAARGALITWVRPLTVARRAHVQSCRSSIR